MATRAGAGFLPLQPIANFPEANRHAPSGAIGELQQGEVVTIGSKSGGHLSWWAPRSVQGGASGGYHLNLYPCWETALFKNNHRVIGGCLFIRGVIPAGLIDKREFRQGGGGTASNAGDRPSLPPVRPI